MAEDDDAKAITTPFSTLRLIHRKRNRDPAGDENGENGDDTSPDPPDPRPPRSIVTQQRIVSEKESYEQKGSSMPGRPHKDAHQLFWQARREAVSNAKDCYQLADALKETPHMKDEEREVREAIQALEEMQSKLEDEERGVREAVEALKALTERLQCEEETVAEERPLVFPVDHLNSDERDVYDAIPSESIKMKYLAGLQRERQGRLVAEQGRLVAEQRERVTKQQTRVTADLATIERLAADAEWCLLAMSALSQAECTVAENTKQADSMAAEKRRKAEQADEMLKDAAPNVRDPPSLPAKYAAILDKKEKLPKPLDRKSLLELDCGEPLRRVSRAFAAAMGKANFMHRTKRLSQEYKEKICSTVEKLRSMFMSAVENEQDDGRLESAMTDKDLPFAGPTSQEVAGVQPILVTLLQAIGDCCQVAYAIPSSPPEHGESEQENGSLSPPKPDVSEQEGTASSPPNNGELEQEDSPSSPPEHGESEQENIPLSTPKNDEYNPLSPPKIGISEQKDAYGNKERRERHCDVTVWSRGNHVFLLLDCAMELTCEIKPGQRLDKSVVVLQQEARDQCLSHVSKALLHSLQFGSGVGVPSHATSIIASLTHIEIIQLHLVDPGKSTCHLEFKTSGPLPLVPEEQFRAWFSSDLVSRKGGVEELRYVEDTEAMAKRMYHEFPDGGMDKSGIPLGIKALYAVMMCPRQELIGPNWRDLSRSLGGLLGTGTFGMVFEAPSKSGAAVVKLSKPGLDYYIKKEANILKWLARKDVKAPASVPQLVEARKLPVIIGNVEFELPALAMKPRGQNIYSCWTVDKRFDIANCILRDIGEALSFIHDQGIVHRDVNDRNILLVPGENGQWKALLIDFSVACQKYEKFTRFTGTPPFVHREVHKSAKWIAAPQYDETSLGFTLVVLLEGGVLPWKGLNDPGAHENVYDERITRATRCLNNIGKTEVGADVARSIEKLILLDKKEFQCSCHCQQLCKRNDCGKNKGKRKHKRKRNNISCTVLCRCYEQKGKCMSGNPVRIPEEPISYEGLLGEDM